jgi:hypothetical protein
MAKKKMNLRSAARRVGSRAKSAAGKLDPMAIVKANAGGFAAAFIVDKLDDIEAVQDLGPFAGPAIVEAGGIVLQMMGKKELEPVAFGMMGAAAALAYAPIMDKIEGDGDEPTDGTNTINAIKVKNRVKNMLKRAIKKANMAPGQLRNALENTRMIPGAAIRVAANAANRMGGPDMMPKRAERWARKYSSQGNF